MENNENLILIDEKDKEEARALTQSFVRSDVKSRAYINALGAELCIKYFRDENISDETTYNIHSIRKFLEEFDISDVMLSNIHVDVRVITDETQIFIPISHFKYNIVPDIYIVLKILNDHSGAEFLGYFEPKAINKSNKNDKYYFIEKENLSSPETLKDFISNYVGHALEKEFSEEEIEKAEFLMVSMADNNAGEAEKKELISYLKNSEKLRNRFIEFENGEMLCYKAVNEMETDMAGLGEADLVLANNETSSEDISELNIEDVADIQPLESELATGVAVGSGIAGAAIASAALAGGEGAVSAIGSAIDAGETILDAASDLAQDISNSFNNDDTTQNSFSEGFGAVSASAGTDDAGMGVGQENSELFSTFEPFRDNGGADISFNSSETDDLVFENNSDDYSSDEIVFENHDDYDDEVIFENCDDDDSGVVFGSATPSSGGGGQPRIETTINTPLSEATELVSLDAIKENNLPPENKVSVNFEEGENILDTENFNNLSQNVANTMRQIEEEGAAPISLDDIKLESDIDENKEMTKLPALDDIDADDIDISNEISDNQVDMDEIPLDETPRIDNVSNDLTSSDFVQELPEIESSQELQSDIVEENSEVSDISAMKEIQSAEITENINGEYVSERAEESAEINEENTSAPAIDENVASEIVDTAERELFGIQSSISSSPDDDSDSIAALEPENSVAALSNSPSSFGFEAPEPPISEDSYESPELSLIYNDASSPDVSDIADAVDYDTENYNFAPQSSFDVKKFAPVIAAVVVVVLGVSLVGFFSGKNKNKFASEDTVLQTSPENEAVVPPIEGDNMQAMNGEPMGEPMGEGVIPPAAPSGNADTGTLSTMDDQADRLAQMNKQAKQAAIQDMKNSVTRPSNQKPITRSNIVSVKKLSWSVPDYLSYSDNIKKYLQTAGKSIKLSLSSDLLLTNDYIYSNQVGVSLKMSKDGTIQSSQISKSSGSTQVDNIVLQNVKDTLNVIKPPAVEVPTPTFKLGLTISL